MGLIGGWARRSNEQAVANARAAATEAARRRVEAAEVASVPRRPRAAGARGRRPWRSRSARPVSLTV